LISVTADTNIYISGLNFGGKPRQFLMLAENRIFRLDISEAIMAEIQRVLAYPKIGWPEERIEKALRQIERFTHRAMITSKLNVVTADPSDNRLLECAIAMKSQYLVSGDEHLLALGQYEGIRIVTLTEFMEILRSDARRLEQ
jgi:putative PIN family toxin of toxin-antitoxin system